MLRLSSNVAFVLAMVLLLSLSAGQTAAQPVYVQSVPQVSYYYPPASVPVVVPATPVTVTTYRYGLLFPRQVTVQTYAAPAPAYVAPAPAVTTSFYYSPVVVRPRLARVVYYYPPVFP
jgi:hypothetical protein